MMYFYFKDCTKCIPQVCTCKVGYEGDPKAGCEEIECAEDHVLVGNICKMAVENPVGCGDKCTGNKIS